MVKKIINKEFLEEKIKNLTKQQKKVADIVNQYSKLYDKIEGALEIIQGMLNEFETSKENDNKTKSGSE